MKISITFDFHRFGVEFENIGDYPSYNGSHFPVQNFISFYLLRDLCLVRSGLGFLSGTRLGWLEIERLPTTMKRKHCRDYSIFADRLDAWPSNSSWLPCLFGERRGARKIISIEHHWMQIQIITEDTRKLVQKIGCHSYFLDSVAQT